LEPPAYGPRQLRISQLRAFEPYLRQRLAAFPQLTGRRLHRELRELGYSGGYTILTDLLRELRPNEVSVGRHGKLTP
jgi:transposase